MTRPDYDLVQSTFRVFIVLGERPGEVMRLAVWQILLYAVLVAAVIACYWPLLSLVITSAAQGVEPSDQAVLASLGAIWLGASISVVGGILAALMVQGAWLRLLTHGETKPGIPMRLGGDEGRLFGVNLVFVVFNVIGWGAVTAMLTLLSAGAAIGADNDPTALLVMSPLIAIIVMAVALIAIFIMLRFAAAPAMAVNERRFVLFGSFAATRGVWGWMLLSYLGVIAMAIVAGAVLSILQILPISFAVGYLAGLGSSLDAMGPAEVISALASNPFVIISFIFVLLIQIVFRIFLDGAWHGVGAYVAMRHGGAAPADAGVETPTASVGAAPKEG
jgi:hypothetical protein